MPERAALPDQLPDRRRGAPRDELRQRVDGACGDLESALRRASGADDAVSLESATRAFATALRRAGLPIQRVVALLTYYCARDDRLSFEQREHLGRQRPELVRWAIEAYYAGG